MKWWRRIGHDHRFQIFQKEKYGDALIFKFTCIDCGQLKTKIVNPDKEFDIEV